MLDEREGCGTRRAPLAFKTQPSFTRGIVAAGTMRTADGGVLYSIVNWTGVQEPKLCWQAGGGVGGAHCGLRGGDGHAVGDGYCGQDTSARSRTCAGITEGRLEGEPFFGRASQYGARTARSVGHVESQP